MIEYDAPAGAVGNVVSKVFANPDAQVEEDLQRFKEAIESNGGFGSSNGNA